MTTLAAVQSSYIPWKGYFDLMARADVFILYDCVQYTPRDWRNRNRIRAAGGLCWLTVPVRHGGRAQRICDVVTAEEGWRRRHWQSLRHHYARAPHFAPYAAAVEELYAACAHTRLSEVNRHFLLGLNALLGISTPLLLQEEAVAGESASARLLALCRRHGATRYLSGPKARGYLDVARFAAAGVTVEWMAYDYPEYPQGPLPFAHGITMLDMLFHTGGAWAEHMGPSFPRQALVTPRYEDL